MDEIRFSKNLLGLAELFDKKLSQAVVGFYVSAMKDFTDDEIERAFQTAALTKQFMPKPAELIELINGPQADQGLTAWEQLTEAVQRHGAYDSVMFADTRITRAVEALGGWIAVCNWSVADLHFRRNEFIKFYGAAKPLKEPKVLAGLVELDNKSRGYFDKVPQPAMIGTSEQLQRLEAPREVANAE